VKITSARFHVTASKSWWASMSWVHWNRLLMFLVILHEEVCPKASKEAHRLRFEAVHITYN
jgi:hypothetical protein